MPFSSLPAGTPMLARDRGTGPRRRSTSLGYVGSVKHSMEPQVASGRRPRRDPRSMIGSILGP